MGKLKKILTEIGAIIGVISVLGGAVYWGFDLENRAFTSMENRVYAEKEHKDSPTAEQKQRAMILDSVNKMDAIKSRASRDTLLREILNRQKKQDSINLLNADQMFQIKEELKNIH